MKQIYQEKNVYFQKKENKSLMNLDEHSKIMEYQKIMNLLGTTSNQPSKFRTKNWVEIND